MRTLFVMGFLVIAACGSDVPVSLDGGASRNDASGPDLAVCGQGPCQMGDQCPWTTPSGHPGECVCGDIDPHANAGPNPHWTCGPPGCFQGSTPSTCVAGATECYCGFECLIYCGPSGHWISCGGMGCWVDDPADCPPPDQYCNSAFPFYNCRKAPVGCECIGGQLSCPADGGADDGGGGD